VVTAPTGSRPAGSAAWQWRYTRIMRAKRPVTHVDLARRLGISQSTVSRALDPAQRHLVRPEVVERVLKASAASGFQGNILARRLRNRRAETITAVIPGGVFHPPLVPDFEAGNHLLEWQELHGVLQTAQERGYDVKMVPQAIGDDQVARLLAGIGYPHSDGVVFCGLGAGPTDLGDLRRRGIPWVITGAYDHPARRPLIACDQVPGLEAGITHLLERGHRRIACLTFAADFATAAVWRPRYGTIERMLSQAGCWDPSLLWVTPDESALRARLRDAGGGLPFTAVVCVNDGVAARVVRELVALGRRVPQDVAVLGFDDNPLFHHLQPGLSTVHLPYQEVGRLAAGMLIDAIKGKDPPAELTLIPTTFIARGTT
jgi:DNA-binding LacI/PurR family transcriptional regulator